MSPRTASPPPAAPVPAPAPAPAGSGPHPDGAGWHVDVPLVGPVGWPPTGSLVFLVAVGGLAAGGLLSWPVAGLLGLGHVLAHRQDTPVLTELGEALEDA